MLCLAAQLQDACTIGVCVVLRCAWPPVSLSCSEPLQASGWLWCFCCLVHAPTGSDKCQDLVWCISGHSVWWSQPCGRLWTEQFFQMIFLPSLWFSSVRREARTFRCPPLWDIPSATLGNCRYLNKICFSSCLEEV